MSYFCPKPTTRNLAGIIAALTTLPALAAAPIEEITVTASRTPMPLERVGSSVSVLTTEDLENKNDPLLADTLRMLPGVAVSNSGGLGKDTAVRIRGEESYRTKLFLDGINLTDTTSTQIAPRFDNLLTGQYERVEVLRGAQGMMYSADAGGVISLFSKTAKTPFEGDAQVEAGKFSSSMFTGNVRGKNNNFTYSLGGNFLDGAGFNSRSDDASRDADGYNNQSYHAVVREKFNDQLSVGAVYHYVDSDNQYDNCNYPTVNNCANTQQNRAAKLDAKWSTARQHHSIAYSENIVDNEHYLTGETTGFWLNKGKTSQWQYSGDLQLANDVVLAFGVDTEANFFVDKTYAAEHQRDQRGAYAEWQIMPNAQWSYTLGGRLDDNDDFGNHGTYRLATVYLIPLADARLKLKSAYGTGYRAPSLYEMYYNTSVNAQPGAEQHLQVETSDGFELGGEWLVDNLSLELTAFTGNIHNEIYFDLTNYVGYLQGPSRAESTGLEFASHYSPVAGLTLGANYTYNKANIPSATAAADNLNPARLRRPRNLYNLSVEYAGLGDKLGIIAYYRGQSSTIDVGNRKLDHYQVLDINTTWNFTPKFQTYCRVLNGLNEQYQEVYPYESASRSAFIGARLKF